MATVELRNIGKVYSGGVRAVTDANIKIEDREFVVLVGPSGCGKTTTLRMIAGLEDITEGELYIGDTLVNDLPPKDRDIAMVFQNYALYPHMSVYDNMAFGLKIRKLPKDEIDRRVHDAARILEIENLLKRKPKALSGGQRQRVAVGRAIVRQPKVFLFDEPLSNLDAKLRVQMRAEISGLHDRLKATMIYVTHDQVEAMTMGDKIVVMKDGLIQQIGDPLGLYNNPANRFVAGFIGSPPMNFMKVRVEADGGGVLVDEGSFRLRLDGAAAAAVKPFAGKELIFGIRPEDLAVGTPITGTGAAGAADTDDADVKAIPARVEVVEPLGAEIHLHVRTEQNTIIARVSPNNRFRVGDRLKLIPDLDKAKFFETDENGKTISGST